MEPIQHDSTTCTPNNLPEVCPRTNCHSYLDPSYLCRFDVCQNVLQVCRFAASSRDESIHKESGTGCLY